MEERTEIVARKRSTVKGQLKVFKEKVIIPTLPQKIFSNRQKCELE